MRDQKDEERFVLKFLVLLRQNGLLPPKPKLKQIRYCPSWIKDVSIVLTLYDTTVTTEKFDLKKDMLAVQLYFAVPTRFAVLRLQKFSDNSLV